MELLAAVVLVSAGLGQNTGEPAKESGMLRLTIVESEGLQPVPCRVHMYDTEGEPQKAGDLPFFRDHFVCPGQVEVALPAGDYTYEIERGPEYTLEAGSFTSSPGKDVSLVVTLRRMVDLPGQGWYPGDLHIHRPPEQMELLMLAEDLYVAPVITWWNQKNLWADRPMPADPLVRFDNGRCYHLMAGEDERNGGAFLYFNGNRPQAISEAEKEWPSPIAFLEGKGADTWIDIEKPFWWDVPVALAHGFGDSIGLANNHMCRSSMYETEAWGKPRDVDRLPAPRGNGFWSQEIYYHVLNCGFRIPPSAGSASGVLPNPVGYDRVYVHVPDGLTYAKWWEGLRAGHCFVTNGPLLLVQANGEIPGKVFQSDGPMDINLTADITTRDAILSAEIVKNGVVTTTIPFTDWEKDRSLGTVRFEESGWFLIRALTARQDTFRFASSAPFYVEIGDTPKRISRRSAEFFCDWVRERKAAVNVEDPEKAAEVMRYHEQALAFWESLVERANAD